MGAERGDQARPRRPLGAEDQSSPWPALAVPPELVELVAERVAARLAEVLPERPEPWLDTDAAAEYLAAPRSRVYELVERERLRPHRDGRRLLFRRADLDAALDPPEGSP